MNREIIQKVTVTFEYHTVYEHRGLAMFPLVTPLLSKLTTILIGILNSEFTVDASLLLVLFNKLIFL